MSYRFNLGQQFHWHDSRYEIVGTPDEQRLDLVNLDTRELQTVAREELLDAFFATRSLRFCPTHESTKIPSAGNGASHLLADLDAHPQLMHIAQWRFEVIAPLLDLPQRTRQVVAQRVAEVRQNQSASGGLLTAVSVTSVYRWLRRYHASGGDPRALIPNTWQRGGKGRERLDPSVDRVVEEILRGHQRRRERITVATLQQLVSARLAAADAGLPETARRRVPSYATVYRRLEALDLREPGAARQSKSGRTARWRDRQYHSSDTPKHPLEQVEIDHTRSDLIVIDDADNLPLGRLTFSYALDLATRYPLGYSLSFEPPSYHALAQCLHHAILPKPDARVRYGTAHAWLAHGLFGLAKVDNALEMRGHDLADAAFLLGFTLQHCPVATPEFKGGVERAIRTHAQGIFHTLPGTTFANPIERRDYDSRREACIALSEIDRILHLYMLDLYAESYHQGLGGVPARAWERSCASGFTPRLPESAEALTILLGQTTNRRVWHYGIDWDHLRYQSPVLSPLRQRLKGQPVKVKRDPGDLSRIHVYDPFEARYLEIPILPEAQDYARGLSRWKHQVICALVRATGDRVELAALGRARAQLQELVDASRARTKARLRQRAARWQTAGQATRELTVDAAAAPALVPAASGALPWPQATPETLAAEASPLVPASQATDEVLAYDDADWEVLPGLPKASG